MSTATISFAPAAEIGVVTYQIGDNSEYTHPHVTKAQRDAVLHVLYHRLDIGGYRIHSDVGESGKRTQLYTQIPQHAQE